MWRRIESVSNDHSESNFNIDYASFNKLKGALAANCVLYFPFNRFEEPAWLNKQNLTAQVQYVDRKRLTDHTSRQAIATSPLHENQSWLFDVIYDRRVPETRTVRVPNLGILKRNKQRYVIATRACLRLHSKSFGAY